VGEFAMIRFLVEL